jgi:hypothetical protein
MTHVHHAQTTHTQQVEMPLNAQPVLLIPIYLAVTVLLAQLANIQLVDQFQTAQFALITVLLVLIATPHPAPCAQIAQLIPTY